ncbi:hypothetical protein [Phytohabitans rumicis]|uniref:Uncharacterized protein n=1 Tax=Phytohabitans rumicis TaxID=1076125 RepID=A0A6V8LI36_9ACTN|nr:hypothetical protein [Phytohabitans rumicis]GFJ95844.1 hypothetical protein Prum_094860 [Phytohabitans rumicis]
MKRRLWALAALLGAVLAVAGWIVYLATIGLDRADQLSSVVGAILAAVVGVAGLVVAFRTWPRGRIEPPAGAGGEVPPAAPVQINQASGAATMFSVQGGDLIIGEPGPSDER